LLDRFSKNPQISDLMKNCPVEIELCHEDRGSDRHDEPHSRFSYFAKAPKNIEKSIAYLVTVWYCKIVCSYHTAGTCIAVWRRGHLE
jgi:hypothetical protein